MTNNDEAKFNAELDAIKADHEARGDDVVRQPAADQIDPDGSTMTPELRAQGKEMADQFVEAHDPRGKTAEQGSQDPQERTEVFVDQQVAKQQPSQADGPKAPGHDQAKRQEHLDDMAVSQAQSDELNDEAQWEAAMDDWEDSNPETGQDDVNDDTLEDGQEEG